MEHGMMGNDTFEKEYTGFENAEQGIAGNDSLAHPMSEEERARKRRQMKSKNIMIFWRGLADYFEEEELLFYRDLCRGKDCLAQVGNAEEDHCVYSAWVAFEMVRYYDRDIEALEEMRRYLAQKADEEPDWKDHLRDTFFGFFSPADRNKSSAAASYYRDARDVVTEILKLRKGLKTYDGTLG